MSQNSWFDEMSQNSWYDELANDVDYYRSLLQLLNIHPMINGWVSWKLWEKWKERQISILPDWKKIEKPLNAKDMAIIAIAFAEWKDESDKLLSQADIINSWIVSEIDLIQSTLGFIKVMKSEHINNERLATNLIDNSAKICILKWAYEKIALHLSENHEVLNDSEHIILLGYIFAILGYRYELRPYMINPNLITVDWVAIYDSMFNNFSNVSRKEYIEQWYIVLWEIFRSIRNEIATKKLTKKTLQRMKVTTYVDRLIAWKVINQSLL